MYRTIDTAMWYDERIRGLAKTPHAVYLFMYLVTNSHSHVSGIYHITPSMMAEETGLKPRTVNTLLHTLSSVGLTRFDPKTAVIWVVNMFRRQGKGEKNERSAASHLESIHNLSLVNDFLQLYPSVKQYISDTLSHTLSHRGSEFGIQEQEQEQEKEQYQEQEQEKDCDKRFVAPSVAEVTAYCTDRGKGIDPQQFIDHYTASGWILGSGQKMKDWKASVRTWEKNKGRFAPKPSGDPRGTQAAMDKFMEGKE